MIRRKKAKPISQLGKIEYVTWRNETDFDVSFSFFLGTEQFEVELAPGESIELDSRVTEQIRKTNPVTGSIEGGLCPYLTLVGDKKRKFRWAHLNLPEVRRKAEHDLLKAKAMDEITRQQIIDKLSDKEETKPRKTGPKPKV